MAYSKKVIGRPPKYTDPAEMQVKIDEYFDKCRGEPLYKPDGSPALNNKGELIMIGAEPPTVTGLALYLGFLTRDSLLDYAPKSKEFFRTITIAKQRIQAYAEKRLFDRDGNRGAEFYLRTNFGWKDKEEDKQESAASGIVIIPAVLEEQDE